MTSSGGPLASGKGRSGAVERGGVIGGVRGWRGWPEVVGRGGNGGGGPANSGEVAQRRGVRRGEERC